MSVAPAHFPAFRFVLSRYKLICSTPVLVGAIMALSALLRFAHLGARSLWLDEGMTAALARLDWTKFLQALWAHELSMAPYYILLRLWTKIGFSEVALRSLSVLPAIATILVIYVLGELLFDRKVGLLSAVLLSVHPAHIMFSQQARSYSLVVFLCVLSWQCGYEVFGSIQCRELPSTQ